ncbi:DUF6427 family protein [Mariniphaga sp.]|uniref:DUF6427 family protein n=1 Tax=Mariniphaga sp. TaxID=1954475 RepID=UPI003568433F
MLLRTLKSNRAVNFFLFPFLGILFWLKSLIYPRTYTFYNGEADNILYKPIHNLTIEIPILQIIIPFILIIGMALIMLQLNNKYNIIRIRTMLPAPLFILIVSGFSDLHTMHPVYFAAFFVLLAIYRLFSAFDEVKPYSPAFDSGFFLGVASLFYFNVFLSFPAFLIGLAVLSREPKWREFIVNAVGFFLPFIFAFSYVFILGKTPAFLETLEMNILTPVVNIKSKLPVLVYLGFLLVLILLGSLKLLHQYDTKKVSTRKYFIVLFLVFLFLLASFLLIPSTSIEIFVIAAIPLTFLLANFFVFLKSRFWGEFLFSLLLISVIILEILA